MSRQPKNPALLNATQGDVVALINVIMSPIVRDLKAEIATLREALNGPSGGERGDRV